ncbi:general odorant-binding protein 56d [Drosophila yakuba]|uniref:Odorant-binding protein 56d n=1 Tax=Drosophila yakuba TaxID=7245 RepID=B4PB46_DROYA|nr:general odorant-binding protein 56d [Drosophila yakuba]EDW91459.2 Odorant-binding protein 56d [Drosophila yakuba]
MVNSLDTKGFSTTSLPKMKFLIVLSAILAMSSAELQLSDEQKAVAHANGALCAQQEGITKDQAIALRNGNFENSDPKIKCFANCFLEKTGFLINGEVQPDVVLAKLGPLAGEDAVKAVQAKCDAIKGADKCDTAYQLFECYYKNRAHI